MDFLGLKFYTYIKVVLLLKNIITKFKKVKIMSQAKAKNIIQQTITRDVNFDTGETSKETTESIIYLPSEPPFVKLYLDDITKLFGLPKSSSSILNSLLKKMDYDGIITLVGSSKKRIAEDIGVKLQTIDNAIQTLLKTDILRRVDRGEYMFNPSIFARGDWKSIVKQRDKFLELTIRYTSDGKRTIKSEIK